MFDRICWDILDRDIDIVTRIASLGRDPRSGQPKSTGYTIWIANQSCQ